MRTRRAALALLAVVAAVQLGGQAFRSEIAGVPGLPDELAARPRKGLGYAPSKAIKTNAAGDLEAVVGNSTDCVLVDGTSQPCSTGSGDVVGPASATDGVVALFNGVTGKLLKVLTGTGVLKITSGVPSVVAGTGSDCVKVDGTSGACGSGEGGASSLAGLSDLKVTATSTVLSIAVGYSQSLDSSGMYVATEVSAGSVTRVAGTDSGTWLIEVTDGGVLQCLYGTGITVSNYSASGCTMASSNAFTVGARPLASVNIAGGSFSTPTDYRTLGGTANYTAGSGLTKAGRAFSVNAAVVAFLSVANSWVAKQLFTPTASEAGLQVGCAALPSSPSNGDIACDSADSNQVKAYSNGAWVASGGGTATPGGSTTQIQYNNAGAFGGDSGLTFDSTNKIVTLSRSNTSGTAAIFRAINTAATNINAGARLEACQENSASSCAVVESLYYDGGTGYDIWTRLWANRGGSYQLIARRGISETHIGGEYNVALGHMAVNSAGATRFANAATAGRGLVSIQGAPSKLTGQTGDGASFNVLAASHLAGTYRVCGTLSITTAGTGTVAAWTMQWRSPASGTDLNHDLLWVGEVAGTVTPVASAQDEFHVCKVVDSAGTSAIAINPGNTDATYTTGWIVECLR